MKKKQTSEGKEETLEEKKIELTSGGKGASSLGLELNKKLDIYNSVTCKPGGGALGTGKGCQDYITSDYLFLLHENTGVEQKVDPVTVVL